MKISAVIITKNEEDRIESCIRSVLPFADEVLVLDSFSEDNTRQKSENLGAVVVQRAFEGYGKSKNIANDLTSGTYIFSIDADEVVDKELCDAILEVKSSNQPGTVYSVARLSNYCGSWIRFGGWNPDIKPRLWKRGVAEWNLAEVHEKLGFSREVHPTKLSGYLHHFSYRTKEEHLRKIKNYSQKGATELHRSGKKPGKWRQYFSPISRWLRDYIFKLGFLDGLPGLRIANLTAFEVFEKYRLYFNQR